MVAAHGETTSSRRVDRDAIYGLRKKLRGPVSFPGEPEYDASRRIWNAMIDKRPAVIVRPGELSDIQRTVRFA